MIDEKAVTCWASGSWPLCIKLRSCLTFLASCHSNYPTQEFWSASLLMLLKVIPLWTKGKCELFIRHIRLYIYCRADLQTGKTEMKFCAVHISLHKSYVYDSKSVSCYLESEVFDFICQLTSTFWWNTAIHFLVQSSLYAHSKTPASEQLTENTANNLNIIKKRFSPAVIESDRILFAGF